MTTVTLLDRLSVTADDVKQLSTLPHRYVVAARGEYAHLARAANRKPRGMSVTTLCGHLLHDPILTDEPVGPICGTCQGRHLGLTDDTYAFRPRTWFSLPKHWCRSIGYVEGERRDAMCLCCGWVGGTWYHGGPWGGHVAMRKHEHGGRGVLCPDHGQRNIAFDQRAETLYCNAFRCSRPPLVWFGPGQ